MIFAVDWSPKSSISWGHHIYHGPLAGRRCSTDAARCSGDGDHHHGRTAGGGRSRGAARRRGGDYTRSASTGSCGSRARTPSSPAVAPSTRSAQARWNSKRRRRPPGWTGSVPSSRRRWCCAPARRRRRRSNSRSRRGMTARRSSSSRASQWGSPTRLLRASSALSPFRAPATRRASRAPTRRVDLTATRAACPGSAT